MQPDVIPQYACGARADARGLSNIRARMHHRASTIQRLWNDAAQRTGEWDSADVLEILTETRKLLENRNLRQAYPLLYLYCDWSLHDSISRSDMARRVLRSFFDHLVPLQEMRLA